jgi:hypothetical protein
VFPQESGVVNVTMHPNSDDPPDIVDPMERYVWTIKNCFARGTVRAAIILLSRPEQVFLEQGYVGSNEDCNRFSGTYLRAAFHVPVDSLNRIATLIIPFISHTPITHRLAGDGYSGMRVNHADGVQDVLIVPTGRAGYAAGNMAVDAAFAWWRVAGDTLASYAVRQGTKFRAAAEWGFDSETPVSIVVCGSRGTVVSPGSFVTFRDPRERHVVLDGAIVKRAAAGRFFIPAGTHSISFLR